MDLFQMYWVEIVFGSTILLSFLTGNKTMGISALIILLLRLMHANNVLQIISTKGADWGIILLTVAVFAPLALNKYDFSQFKAVILSPSGWIAILAGILVTILGTKGVATSTSNLTIVLGVTLGSVAGVVALHGTPMGPMIGSGIAAFGIILYQMIVH